MNKEIKGLHWFFTMVKEKRIMADDVHLRSIEQDGKSRNVSNFPTRA